MLSLRFCELSLERDEHEMMLFELVVVITSAP